MNGARRIAVGLAVATGMSCAGAVAQPAARIDANAHGGLFIAGGFRFMPVARLELHAGGDFNHSLFTDQFVGNVPGFQRLAFARAGSMQVLTNLYLDFAPFFPGGLGGFNPYVTGGLGLSVNRTSDIRMNNAIAAQTIGGSGATRASFAWTLGIGVQLDPTLQGMWTPWHGIILDIGYRYLDAGSYRWNTGTPGGNLSLDVPASIRNTSHQVMISLIIPFDRILTTSNWNGSWPLAGPRRDAFTLIDPRDHLYGRIGAFGSWPVPARGGPNIRVGDT